MARRIARTNLLVATLASLIFLLIFGPEGRLLRAQEAKEPPEEETQAEIQVPEEEEQPEEEAPRVPRVRPAPRARPPAATPERRLVPPAVSRADMVSLNFNRADLIEVIHVLAQHLKLTYTIDPDVKGTVTINSAEPLKKEDLLPVFHQLLRMNGAVAVKTGDLYRIAPIKEGKGLARPVGLGREDSYAIQVVPVRFFSVGEMKKLLTPFVTPGGEIIDYPRGNFFMIMDLPSNIQRLMEIRDMIDVQTFAGTRMEIYQPKVASAEELAAEMTKVMQAFAASAAQAEGFAAQFLPVPRINQLFVISYSEAAWTYAKRWLERLDTIGEGPGRKIFIYPVENGKATDLADVLTQALGIPGGAQRAAPRTLEQLHRGTQPTTPTTPGTQRSTGTPYTAPPAQAQLLGDLYAVAPAPAQPPPAAAPPTAPPRAPTPARPPEGRPEAKPEEQLRIVADPATNTLIIYGTAQEFQNIKNILKELDLVPRQVLLETLIAEIKLTGSNSLGFDYQAILGLRKGDTFTGDFATTTTDPGPPPVVVPAPRPAIFGSTGITALVGDNRIRGLIKAFMEDKRAKILASPTILATDNKPARIQIGDEVPIATGTLQTAVGSTDALATSNTIQFRNTGKILTIIPQVNAKGLVHMQIKAEVSKRGVEVKVGSQTFSSFETRDAETTAVVKDGETLVIGGIISEDRSHGRSGIPFLMDLPVFGWFFSSTTDTLTERTELVILVTPHVIRNLEESRSVTEDFKQKLSTVSREIDRMRREGENKEALPQKPSSVTPEKGSKVILIPGLAPENAAVGGARGGNAAGRETAPPAEATVEAAPSQDVWKSVVKFLSFGLL